MSLIDRVRERLAAESAPLRPNVVAAAIRAESGGVLGDTEVLSNLRMLQTELTGVGHPGAAAACGGHHRRLGHRAGRGVGRRWKRVAAQLDPVCRRGRGTAAGAAAGLERGASTRRGTTLGRRTADRCGRRPVHRPAARRACADRIGRHLPVAACAAAGDPGPRHADAGRGDRRGRPPHCSTGSSPPGWRSWSPAAPARARPRSWRPRLARYRRDERIICVEDAAELEPRHPHLVKLVARCANVEGVGEITVRDLVRQALRMRPGPDRRRRGARRGGGRPAGRAQHGPRRRRGNRPCEQSRRGAGPARGAGSARRPRPLCVAQSTRGGGAGAAARRSGPRTASAGSARSRCCGGMATAWSGWRPPGTPTPDSEAAPSI